MYEYEVCAETLDFFDGRVVEDVVRQAEVMGVFDESEEGRDARGQSPGLELFCEGGNARVGLLVDVFQGASAVGFHGIVEAALCA